MTALPGSPHHSPFPPRPARPGRPQPGTGTAALIAHPSSEAARLRRLIDAQQLINSDLSLPDVLRRIVGTACELSGARFGALGVISADDRLEHLVQAGEGGSVDPSTPVAAGPHDHTMSFLGVPITVRDDVVGEIYLAEPRAGRFSAEDEDLVTALAATAGTAIVNARLYEESRRSNEWAHASHEITRALLAEADVDLVLEVVSQALEAADADLGMLALPGRDGVLRATVTVGLGADRVRGWTFCPVQSQLAAAMTAGESVLRNDVAGIANPAFDNVENFGPVMSAPLVDARGVRGSVLLLRTADRAPFTTSEGAHLTSFADQVALALDMSDARDDAEWLRVLEVRHQLARDLHDNVIQRLFATGMGLHSIPTSSLPEQLGDRLARYVAELDDTIDEVRERVFGLQESAERETRSTTRFPRLRATRSEPGPHRRAPSPRPRH